MPQSTPPPPSPIDLSEVTEATRRALYDATVAIHFAVPPGTEDYMPFYDADQAGLFVWHWAGRWFASWKALEETDNARLPPDTKRPLLRIVEDPEAPYEVLPPSYAMVRNELCDELARLGIPPERVRATLAAFLAQRGIRPEVSTRLFGPPVSVVASAGGARVAALALRSGWPARSQKGKP